MLTASVFVLDTTLLQLSTRVFQLQSVCNFVIENNTVKLDFAAFSLEIALVRPLVQNMHVHVPSGSRETECDLHDVIFPYMVVQWLTAITGFLSTT